MEILKTLPTSLAKLVEHGEKDLELLLFSERKEDEDIFKSVSRGFAYCDLSGDDRPPFTMMLKFDQFGDLRFDIFGCCYRSRYNYYLITKALDALEVCYDEDVLFYRTADGWFGAEHGDKTDFFVGQKKLAYNLFVSKSKNGTTRLGWYDTIAEEFKGAEYNSLLFEDNKNPDDIEVVAALINGKWDIFELGELVDKAFCKMRTCMGSFVFKKKEIGYELIYSGDDTLPEGIDGDEQMVLTYDHSLEYGKLTIFNENGEEAKTGKISIVNGNVLIVGNEIISFDE